MAQPTWPLADLLEYKKPIPLNWQFKYEFAFWEFAPFFDKILHFLKQTHSIQRSPQTNAYIFGPPGTVDAIFLFLSRTPFNVLVLENHG